MSGRAVRPGFRRTSGARSASPQNLRAEMSHVMLVSRSGSGYFGPAPTDVVWDSISRAPRNAHAAAILRPTKPVATRCAPSMTQAKALIIPVTPFQQNCTLLWCEATKRGVVIDPGGDLPDIERAIAQANVAVDKIWLTHGHVDHVAGAAALKARLKVPIEGPHRDDLFLLEHVVESARNFGMQDASSVTPDRWLEERDQVEVGELTFAVVHCPGHSPGSVVFLKPRSAWRSSATCCSRARSAAPISLGAIRDNCSNRSGTSSCPWRTMLRSSADTGRRRPSAANGRPTPFFNCWPRLPVNALMAPRRLVGHNARRRSGLTRPQSDVYKRTVPGKGVGVDAEKERNS